LASAPTPINGLNILKPSLDPFVRNHMENPMNIANSDPKTGERISPLIDQLRRRAAAAGRDPVPASVYEAQEAHWAANYSTRPYVEAGEDYDDYAPAYLYGIYYYHSNPERQFDSSEADLSNGWDAARGDSPLDWRKAKPAVEEAWYQVRDLAERARSERAELLSTSPTAHTPGDR
jgi:hypothetical protein